MDELKPIPTHYRGYYFRSRLEARYGVFMDAIGIEWEYEKEGYNLDDAGLYLPDFWLPQVSMWAEVKPVEFSPEENRKAKALAKASRCPVLRFVGQPQDEPYSAWVYQHSELFPEGDCFTLLDFCLTMYKNYPTREHRFYCEPSCYGLGGDAHYEDTKLAAEIALSARFEHGEQPITAALFSRLHV